MSRTRVKHHRISPSTITPSLDYHAESIGLPHVGIEIRQDLIDDEQGVAAIGVVLERIVASLPARLTATNIKTRHRPVPV